MFDVEDGRLTKIAIYVLALTIMPASGHAEVAGSRAYGFQENNAALIRQQERGGSPSRSGEVKLEFYGHEAFKLTTPHGLSIVVDPWRNDPSGAIGKWFSHDFPEIPVDIALSTHAHFDHDATERPHALMVMDRLVGTYRIGDLEILGLADKHQCASASHHKWDQLQVRGHFSTCPPNEPLNFDNAIQVIRTGGLRIVFWGDNRDRPNVKWDRFLKKADVMVLPIDDSQTLLTREETREIVRRYRPKAIIPAHYLVKGLLTESSGFKTADAWVAAEKDVRRIVGGEIFLSPAKLRGAHERVYYFGQTYKLR